MTGTLTAGTALRYPRARCPGHRQPQTVAGEGAWRGVAMNQRRRRTRKRNTYPEDKGSVIMCSGILFLCVPVSPLVLGGLGQGMRTEPQATAGASREPALLNIELLNVQAVLLTRLHAVQHGDRRKGG